LAWLHLDVNSISKSQNAARNGKTPNTESTKKSCYEDDGRVHGKSALPNVKGVPIRVAGATRATHEA
jgi:hypothetical protein